ncbi:hypothetical protein BDV23DRAFT_172392 [Aspergillus alliaceus]|uniref:Uncharacterized protein n=1 Tax=Petromyces alliaceus TaxID=209559 RepID=A0A5N7C8V3_PETAA|nr:uncharacterized protein BDW43DRAFT_201982 [Aspergillus alliaceus]KAB8237181.1 hypothetical protein BDW43DRAFT_201982 [Aspergillus alliaceus]KAE8390409.1 hypothetical protein BDV23DRAFT_172392 [Aspergillus alliaceus]
MVPRSSQLTVIVTTSPTPSIPSTELLSLVLQSFRRHCTDLISARVIVVFDTYDRVGPRSRLKRGQVTPEVASNYGIYKQNIKGLILREYAIPDTPMQEWQDQAEFGLDNLSNVVDLSITQTEDKQVTFIEPAARLGFGLAVRSALRVCETPYVWVQQHDWALVADIPLAPLLDIMEGSDADKAAPVKYVSFLSVRMLSYAAQPCVLDFPGLRAVTRSLTKGFVPPSRPGVSVPLTPLYFWFDKPHIASTEHYLSKVFPNRLTMRRGEFIEDKVGQQARQQMKEGLWQKWATWLYYPEEGKKLCLGHLQGRTWKGTEGEILTRFGYSETETELT